MSEPDYARGPALRVERVVSRTIARRVEHLHPGQHGRRRTDALCHAAQRRSSTSGGAIRSPSLPSVAGDCSTASVSLDSGSAWTSRRDEVPRVALLRSIMLNHWYHHRGQLSVYLRLLDVPVPVVYGRTADENPFAT